ncbi:nitric oxide dioxygenase [Thermoflavimicrobium dichotomicum]|uniref:Flavohemoprotein n=2 Tax=Thermoflavimicrobium dichotomicum TaxID=46223 RepID=A0A1I3NN95_9BACL|nr:nitric oxide dioxygenase [Thermoflavimicrobium dichotomicum]
MNSMLSPKTISIIKSTVPVLKEHGEKITTHFYQTMLAAHPELNNIFNQAHQKLKDQPRALAESVYAAAANIDHLEKLLPAIEHIFHKHCSIGILPEHYPIVGKYLLQAIKDVLGDAATDEIIEAWREAYGVLADIFITKEKELYKQMEQQPGGWAGYRPFIVDKKVKESCVITSFYLKPADGKPIASYQPGQYISIRVKAPDYEYTMIRQYSLSDAPGKDYYRISVKREDGTDQKPAGMVSTYLHEQIQEGDIVEISAPAGIFYLDQEKETPVVLLSGGVGMTPLISMLNTIVEKQPNRKVTYIHAAINSEYHAMDDHVRTLAQQHENIQYYVVYEKPTEKDRAQLNFDKEGYVDQKWLASVLSTTDADFYFCGPVPFMRTVRQALENMGVPADRMHFELFGSTGVNVLAK